MVFQPPGSTFIKFEKDLRGPGLRARRRRRARRARERHRRGGGGHAEGSAAVHLITPLDVGLVPILISNDL